MPLDTEETVWEPGMFFSRANMTVGKTWLAVVEIRRASEGELHRLWQNRDRVPHDTGRVDRRKSA